VADITYKLLKKSLDASALRQRVIANNIANINTKGFKKSDVVFEETLKGEMKRYVNNPDTAKSVKPEVIKDETTGFRQDGNNVDIDLEMSNMAANNIQYNTLVTQLNSRLSLLKYVISEGRK